jgi:hypothetical protein
MFRYSIERVTLPTKLSALQKDLNLDVSAVAMDNKLFRNKINSL